VRGDDRIYHHGGRFEFVFTVFDLPLRGSDEPYRLAQLWCCKSDSVIFMDEILHRFSKLAYIWSNIRDFATHRPESWLSGSHDERIFRFERGHLKATRLKEEGQDFIYF